MNDLSELGDVLKVEAEDAAEGLCFNPSHDVTIEERDNARLELRYWQEECKSYQSNYKELANIVDQHYATIKAMERQKDVDVIAMSSLREQNRILLEERAAAYPMNSQFGDAEPLQVRNDRQKVRLEDAMSALRSAGFAISGIDQIAEQIGFLSRDREFYKSKYEILCKIEEMLNG